MTIKKVWIKPIGVVRSPFTENYGVRRTTIAEVILEEIYSSALNGIEDYSHIIMLFWLHKISDEERKVLTTYPRGHEELPGVGVFASRGKSRPNPIGLAVVELLNRHNNILKVRGLDAYDGTPVLDVKPYDHYDVKQNIRVPDWWLKISKHRNLNNDS